MLTAIRDRVSGWIAYFVVLLISIPFALWGIDQYFGGGDPRVAAEVNGVEIPMQAFASQYQQHRSYLQQLYGGELPPGQDDAAIQQAVIQGMVRAQVLQQETQAAGYRVGDQPLLEEISSIEAFKTDGRFDPRRYEQLLQVQQQTKSGFEQNLRQQIGLSYFEDGIWRSAFLPPASQRHLLSLKNQRREFAYFVIPAEAETIDIGVQAVAEYYEANRASFQTPERVKVAYLELSERAVRDDIRTDEDTLLQHYQSQPDRYIVPEQRKARHILISVPADADQAVVDGARQRAAEVVARLESGEAFEKVAAEYSDDELSASAGGDLGLISRGDMNPSFEDALFSLEEGEISDPVKTELGFQIIQPTEIRPARQERFEDVRAEVEEDYRRSEAQQRFIEQAEQLLTLTYEQSTSLEPAAEALGLEIQRSDWLTRNQGSDIAANPEIRNAAFQRDVLQDGRNSDMVELDQGHAVVLRVIEHEPAQPQPLDEVRGAIEQILAVREARQQAAEAGRQALAKLREGAALDEVARQHGATVETPGFVGRDGVTAPQPIVAEAFALDKPSSEGAIYGGVRLADGYAVIALREVQPGETGASDTETPPSAEPAVVYGQRERDAVYRALEEQAEIQIMRENL